MISAPITHGVGAGSSAGQGGFAGRSSICDVRFAARGGKSALPSTGNSHDMEQRLSAVAPYVRSILRFVTGLLFLEHGLSRLFAWPQVMDIPSFPKLYWFAGAIELVAGILLPLGLFTRCAAFVASGEMAFAYFM